MKNIIKRTKPGTSFITRSFFSEAVQIELAKAFVAVGTLSGILVFTQFSTNKRFEDSQKASDKRFEDSHKSSDKRFEDAQKSSDKRFDASDKRFADLLSSLKDSKIAERELLDLRLKNIADTVDKTTTRKKWFQPW